MRRRAFTLIEVLVVTAIVAVLAAILFPVLASARAAARRAACIGNLRQIGLALGIYRQDWEEFPPLLSRINESCVREPRVFVCPSDPERGLREGTVRLEGTLHLPTGVSYDYVPRWRLAQELGWWNPPPALGPGKWEDLTPIAQCQWHWARRFNPDLDENEKGARGWQLVLTAGGSVRRLRAEIPPARFTPDLLR